MKSGKNAGNAACRLNKQTPTGRHRAESFPTPCSGTAAVVLLHLCNSSPAAQIDQHLPMYFLRPVKAIKQIRQQIRSQCAEICLHSTKPSVTAEEEGKMAAVRMQMRGSCSSRHSDASSSLYSLSWARKKAMPPVRHRHTKQPHA